MAPTISVIVPVYKNGKVPYMKLPLDSIFKFSRNKIVSCKFCYRRNSCQINLFC